MRTNRSVQCFLLIMSLIILLTGCRFAPIAPQSDALDTQQKTQWNEEATEAGKPDGGNQTRSVFSWHFELTNKALCETYLATLKELGITRVYQNVSAKVMQDDEIAYLIQKLRTNDIDMVPLMGDKSWVEDGLDEYKGIVDAITSYNETAKDAFQIKAIALDVEVHLYEDFQHHKKQYFNKYIDVMAEARQYANERGLIIIQVIPAHYDEVKESLFSQFLDRCCDELSIMNYNKASQDEAISKEVELCKQKTIPVETVFETMQNSEQYHVDETISYYEDGLDVLLTRAENLRKVYGNALGVGFHQFTSLFAMTTGKIPGEINCSPLTQTQEVNPGVLLLYGEDGSVFEAMPYWHKGRKSESGFRYLTNVQDTDMHYTVYYHSMEKTEMICEDAQFINQENGICIMNIEIKNEGKE